MKEPFSFIIDPFTEKRGTPHLIEIKCGKCLYTLLIYQKDGPGPLKRSYLDRIHRSSINLSNGHIIKCPKCQRKLGCLDTYEKENRPAVYWFSECVHYSSF